MNPDKTGQTSGGGLTKKDGQSEPAGCGVGDICITLRSDWDAVGEENDSKF